THPESAFSHQKNHTAELEILNGSQKRFKVSILYRFDTFLRLFEPDDTPGRFPSARMHEKRLEATEPIGDLLVENRIDEGFSTLKLIPVKTADRCHNGVDAPFTERTYSFKRVHLYLPE